MVKACVIITKNFVIFTIYDTLFQNGIKILPITYQDKSKVPEKIESAWFDHK